VKVVDPEWLEIGSDVVTALMEGDAERLHRGVERGGYFHRPDRVDPDWLLAQASAGYEWFIRDQELRIDPDYVAKLMAKMADTSPQALRVARAFKLPPDEIMFRRMSVGVFAVLGHLRARAIWYRLARAYIEGTRTTV
jgi:hypothetical protein